MTGLLRGTAGSTPRPGRERQLEWRSGQRQVGAVGRIHDEFITPYHLHALNLADKSRLLLGRVLVTPGRRFVVVELGKWCPEIAVAQSSDTQAEIDVIERYAQ